MDIQRRPTRTVDVASVKIGSKHPVVLQSMANTDTGDVQATVNQVEALAREGSQLVRIAVPDINAARGLAEISKRSPVPLVADIHFDYKLALHALEAGFDKLRINPGTLAGAGAVKTVVKAATQRSVPIRIGVNSGSVHSKYRHLPKIEALVQSARHYCQVVEDLGCSDIVVSLKSSSVAETYYATEKFSQHNDYPLHLGVTEAGTIQSSLIKSSIGIGALLLKGIGDTLRVSVTGPPETELPIGLSILTALGLRSSPEVISCPTCGRSGYDVAAVAEQIEARLADSKSSLSIAVMGCAVNGPGEARNADLGIAFGPKYGVLFRHGEIVQRLPNEDLAAALLAMVAREEE